MLEPRRPPAEVVIPATTADVAFQAGPQPTNKVATATNWGGTAGGALAAIFTTFGADAIHEMWTIIFGVGVAPMTEKLVTATAIFAVCTFLVRWLGRVAAYNVLDAPNVPVGPVPRPE